jgi:glycosyltransferase involved in cell wall biosynthesis
MGDGLKLSVLIPVYNEEAAIEELIQRVAAVELEKEIIVVDDCSHDATADILAGLRVPNLRVIRHEINRGKGSGVRTALAVATGDVVVIQDADLEYEPQDFARLISPLERGEADVVYGVRDLSSQSWFRHWGNRFLTWATNLLYRSQLQDMETCYKMMTLELARSLDLRARRFDLEPEITAKILTRGHKIREVPIAYTPRVERKLNPWRDGLPALWMLIKCRFAS